ncbi:MAG: hypothetical protein GC162_16795 [Planctomycetes bacterium]|nr:hypothetical protein [Planctomycetota bacterium]
MPSKQPSHSNAPNIALCCIAAWFVPGLGHYLFGEKQRGLIVGITLLILFTIGLLIGGIDVVDHREDPLWFAGQVLIGPPSIIVDAIHTHFDSKYPPSPPTPDSPLPDYEVSVGRVNELGTLYCTLAGVLNLLAILDLFGRATTPAPTANDVVPSSDPLQGRIVTRGDHS